uniref:uncharacterized protein n=1 Tax=Pristiophorus japonicus TaxID=55135 RepID=UPI00398E5CCC
MAPLSIRLDRKKLAHNKRERTRTGEGLPNLHPLTPLEQRVAALMGAWKKAISTAQAGLIREGKEPDANPEDTEKDSDAGEPDQLCRGEGVAMERYEGENLELALPTSSMISDSSFRGLSSSQSLHSALGSGSTFHGFSSSQSLHSGLGSGSTFCGFSSSQSLHSGLRFGPTLDAFESPDVAASSAAGMQYGSFIAPISQPVPPSAAGMQYGTLNAPPSEVLGPTPAEMQYGTPRGPPSQPATPSAGRMQPVTPMATPSQPAPHTGGIPLDRSRARPRRNVPCCPELEGATDVAQVMALDMETNELTQSLVNTVSGVGDEVTTLTVEITILSRDMREDISEAAGTTAQAIREVAAAIREHSQTNPLPLPQQSLH